MCAYGVTCLEPGVTCLGSRLELRRRETSGSLMVRRCGSQTEAWLASTLSWQGLTQTLSAPLARPSRASLSTGPHLELLPAEKRRTWDRDVQTQEESHLRMLLLKRRMS